MDSSTFEGNPIPAMNSIKEKQFTYRLVELKSQTLNRGGGYHCSREAGKNVYMSQSELIWG